MLAIVTTLELDPKSRDYKKPFVEKLSKAAADYLAGSGEAAAFVLMNRARDWGDRSSSGRGEQSSAKTTGKHRRNVSHRRRLMRGTEHRRMLDAASFHCRFETLPISRM